MLPAHNAAGGVIGEREDEEFGPGGDGRLQLLGGQPEVVFLFERDRHRHAEGQLDDRRVGDIAGFRDQDLVPRLDKRPDAEVDPLAAADGDEDLVLRVVGEVEPVFHVFGNRLAQLHQPGVGGIAGIAPLEVVDGGLADGVGGLEVRLADPQGDDPLHLVGDVKKAADAGGFQLRCPFGDQFFNIHQNDTFLLSSIPCCPIRTPCSL